MSEEIRVLSNKEQAREKINVWHGSSCNWINMVKELTGNSLDIFDNDKLNHIQIIIHNNNKIEYIDDANGIPVEGIASNGQPNYEAIFEVPFAGSKYSNSATVGCNGIFLFTLSATCEDIEYFIARPNKNIYNISYHKGDKDKYFSIIGQSDETYSRIIFSLDTDIWDNPNFTFDEICNIVRGQSSLSNVKITVEDRENNKYNEFYYENGISDYFTELTNDKVMITDNIRITKDIESVVEKNNEIDNMSIDLLFNFSNDSLDDVQKDFLNTADLIQHGTIQDGIVLGLKNSINKWLKDNGKYNKGEKNIILEDVSNGLNYICNVKSYQAEYVSQVKQQSLTPHYKPTLQRMIEEYMEIFFIESKEQSERICNQVLLNSRVRINSDKTRQNLRKKLSEKIDNITNRIEGLVDSKIHGEDAELYITEGKSGLGAMVLSRNPVFQAGMPIRGKVLNCLKASYDTIFKNEIIIDLIKVIGTGIECDKKNRELGAFNINNLRYGKIIFLCDEDPDARNIVALLLTMFYRLMPTLLKEGKVYVAKTPLFEIRNTETDEMIYAYSDAEKEKVIKTIPKYKISRNKGIGENDPHVLNETAMNPETRQIVRVDINNIEDMIKSFDVWMDSEVKNRKEYIENHLNEYIIED